MAELPENKMYCVKTDATFSVILNWLSEQARQRKLEVTGYQEAFSNRILSTQGNKNWKTMYHFVRTVGVVMRIHMIRATGIEEKIEFNLSDPTYASNAPNITLRNDPDHNVAINDGGSLAKNHDEACWIMGYFDMLFTHYHEENRLRNFNIRETRCLSDQMIIIDVARCVVWYFTITHRVTRKPDVGGKYTFHVVPFVGVIRYEDKKDAFKAFPLKFEKPLSLEELRQNDQDLEDSYLEDEDEIEVIVKKTRDLKPFD